MQSSIDNGGQTHIKYGHFYYPRVIQAICPFCSKPSVLTNVDAPSEAEFFIDIATYRLQWNLKCDNCLKRKLLTWEETKKIDLLISICIREENIWAWNSNHLDYLIGLLSGNENKNHKWTFYKNYVNKDWLKKTKNKSDLAKLIHLHGRTKIK